MTIRAKSSKQERASGDALKSNDVLPDKTMAAFFWTVVKDSELEHTLLKSSGLDRDEDFKLKLQNVYAKLRKDGFKHLQGGWIPFSTRENIAAAVKNVYSSLSKNVSEHTEVEVRRLPNAMDYTAQIDDEVAVLDQWAASFDAKLDALTARQDAFLERLEAKERR